MLRAIYETVSFTSSCGFVAAQTMCLYPAYVVVSGVGPCQTQPSHFRPTQPTILTAFFVPNVDVLFSLHSLYQMWMCLHIMFMLVAGLPYAWRRPRVDPDERCLPGQRVQPNVDARRGSALTACFGIKWSAPPSARSRARYERIWPLSSLWLATHAHTHTRASRVQCASWQTSSTTALC